jgi:LacI family repressor for deo operon, udp, cdd, tsx, nupC, and nupG
MRKASTIQDVAHAAQVSTATVSRVLSHPKRVSPTTRDAVLDAIAQTGFRVNQAARNLRKQSANAVLVLVPNLGKPFYSGILAGLSEGFAATDYSTLVTDTESKPLEDETLAGHFMDRRIDGAICLDGGVSEKMLEACNRSGVADRIVFLCEWLDGTTYPVVASDNAEGARLAVRHLHGLGHRRIAHVTGPEGNVLTSTRRDGLISEREHLGLPTRSDMIIRGDFSLESGHAAARTILEMERRPTAVFCSADMVAFGLMAGLQAGGLRVPEDISVVGFDDIEMSEYYVPSLTTVRQDRQRLGRRAAELLLERMRTPDAEPAREPLVPVELVVRGSTAPPPK